MNPILLTIVQGFFVYILIWWVVFFISLQWQVPDFWFRLPWTRQGRTVYLGPRQPFGPVAKKFIAASLIAIVVWALLFPLIKGDYLPISSLFLWLEHRYTP